MKNELHKPNRPTWLPDRWHGGHATSPGRRSVAGLSFRRTEFVALSAVCEKPRAFSVSLERPGEEMEFWALRYLYGVSVTEEEAQNSQSHLDFYTEKR